MKVALVPIGDPRQLIGGDIAKIERAINNALNETALAVKADFGVITQTWKSRPSFNIRSGEWERIISTNSEIFGYVDEGTRPHRIEPRNAPRLSFQSGYARKTVPHVIASRPGGAFGGTVYSLGVNHPGFEGAHSAEEIAKKWTREFPRQMDRAILATL